MKGENTEQLKALIKGRTNFLIKVDNFVLKITEEIGIRTNYSHMNAGIIEERRLENINGFDFSYSSSHPMIGGNRFKIWFYKELVLEVAYRGDAEKAEISYIDCDFSWMAPLRAIIRRRKKIIAAHRRKFIFPANALRKKNYFEHLKVVEQAKMLKILPKEMSV